MRSRTTDSRVRASVPGPDLRVYANFAELSRRAAEAVAHTINDAVQTVGTCSIVLAGGNTPRALYRLLASEFRSQVPWGNVQLFWGDERYVPPEDFRSNYRSAKEALLDHVPCPAANIHPMPTHFPSADAAARDYERTLRNHFVEEWPRFDIVLLGLGDDGHTASLFPGALALAERTRWVVAAQAPVEPHVRLTLTLPVVFYSSSPFFSAARRDLRAGRLGMDVPVALAIAAAFAASVWATVIGGEVYFDSLTMFVFLLLGARYLELRARQKAAAHLEALSRAAPSMVHSCRASKATLASATA